MSLRVTYQLPSSSALTKPTTETSRPHQRARLVELDPDDEVDDVDLSPR